MLNHLPPHKLTCIAMLQPLTNSGENRLEVIQSIIAYTACSATMLLINKMVMHAIPLPSMVSVAQFAASCAAVVFVQAIGKTEIENFRCVQPLPRPHPLLHFEQVY